MDHPVDVLMCISCSEPVGLFISLPAQYRCNICVVFIDCFLSWTVEEEREL